MPTGKRQTKNPLRGKVTVITGAGRGIGLAIAKSLASEGCNLVLTGRSLSALRSAERELSRRNIRVVTQACDVRDPESVKVLAATVKKHFRRVDVLINNAGITQPNVFVEKLDYETWKDVIDTNLNGMFLVTHELLPLMRSGGAIVNNLSLRRREFLLVCPHMTRPSGEPWDSPIRCEKNFGRKTFA